MKDNSGLPPTTICSALVRKGNRIALKNTDQGLSLLGGHVKWEYGLPDCVVQRVHQENGIRFTPHYINGITRHYTPSGKEIININIAGPLTDPSDEKNLYWMTVEEALRREDEFRTLDIGALLRRTFREQKLALSYLQVTGQRTPIPHTERRIVEVSTESFTPTDFLVTGGAIRYEEPGKEPEYAFMRCGRPQFGGKLSLFGGKPERGEKLEQALLREVCEESGDTFEGEPLGLIGIYVNDVGEFVEGEMHHAVNFAGLLRARSKNIQLPESKRDEVRGVEWLTLEQLGRVPASELRTPDTREIIYRAEDLIGQRRLFPFSFIEEIPQAT